jgi:hypothetical protein
VALLCLALANADLLGQNLIIITTNSMLAYEAMCGVRFDAGVLATTDIDLLWDTRVKLNASLIQDRLPHLYRDWYQVTSFPKSVARQTVAVLTGSNK